MPVTDRIGTRMKGYEATAQQKLIRRMPVAIRIDGKTFHSFTKGMIKPFDEILIKSIQDTMKYLCENIQGCVFGYAQSDEITLILVDYKNLETSAWFDNEIQKICSISASMATWSFNHAFEQNVNKWGYLTFPNWNDGGTNEEPDAKLLKLNDVYQKAINKGALFDARCFNIPKEEVTNLIYWRQLDATRNSIQMVGRANFSHSELQGKTCNMIQNMLLTEKGINWNNYPTTYKRGSCCVKNGYTVEEFYPNGGKLVKGYFHDLNQPSKAWIIDNDIPIFKNEGRKYIDVLVGI